MIPRRILLVRNDKLGDFMLAWPAIRLLKERLPATELSVLVPEYTRPIAELCPWVDQVVLDPGGQQFADSVALARRISVHHFDAAIALFSTTRVGFALWYARIPLRLAPATKLAQLFYNRRLKQRRSRSEKPEYQYNLDLAVAYLQELGIDPGPPLSGPYLHFPDTDTTPLAESLRHSMGLDAQQRLIFVHPGSGGSANNLTLEQYSALCRELRSSNGHGIVITAGPGEESHAETLAQSLGKLPHYLLLPNGLADLARHLQVADLFISGSTGPLHLAGALDRPTAAFYPSHRSGSALRWQTVNQAQNRLAFVPPEGGDPQEVSRIDVTQAATEISHHYLLNPV